MVTLHLFFHVSNRHDQVLWKTFITFEKCLVFMLYVDYGFNNNKHTFAGQASSLLQNRQNVHSLHCCFFSPKRSIITNYFYNGSISKKLINRLLINLDRLLPAFAKFHQNKLFQTATALFCISEEYDVFRSWMNHSLMIRFNRNDSLT